MLVVTNVITSVNKDEALRKYKDQLPHLYGFKFFNWSRRFWESTNRYTFICCSNQSGKSIVSIRKALRLATDVAFWPKVFKTTPGYGFYFYPSLKLATREFHTKWVTQVLPRGEMKNDPKYGWEAEFKDKEIYCIHFNIGTKIYFMSYSMKVEDLQASSPHWVSADEEMPIRLWGEISARLLATKGLFSMVCTPTTGDDFWRGVFELNKMPDATVIKATMYDTIKFEDGSPGLRTAKEIEEYKAKLPTKHAIDVRVYAKFSKADSAAFPTFDRYIHCVEPLAEARTWPTYAGIDLGTGGQNDAAAIAFIAVRPDFREARVVKLWKGNKAENTSSIDVLRKYQQMRAENDLKVVACHYDQSSKEFQLNAMAEGEMVLPSEKNHVTGQNIMNTLFKHGMLLIEKDCSEDAKSVDLENNGAYFWELLAEMFESMKELKKKGAKDNQPDSVRYGVTKIPFDLSHIGVATVTQKAEPEKVDWNDRRNSETSRLNKNNFVDDIDSEFSFWNDLNNF